MSEHQLSGNLQQTPFADVAGILYRGKRSGSLTISSGERARTVIFYEGSPVAVISADPRDHVASLLASRKKIGAEEAERLRAVPETKEALQSADFIGQDVLMWGLKFRFVSLCYDLFRWTEGEYSFEEGQPPKGIFLMKVPTPILLAKGVKHMPPSLLLERVSSGLEAVPGEAGIEAAGGLGEEERALASLCEGGRTVQDIHEDSTVDPVRAREILYVLSALDIIALRPPEAVPEPEPETAGEGAPPEAELPEETEPTGGLEIESPGGEEAEPTEPEPEPAFEIERHSYEEETRPATPSAEAEEELVPPAEQDLQEGLKEELPAADSGGEGDAVEEAPKPDTPGLDASPPGDGVPELAPIGFDEPAPAAEGGLVPPAGEVSPPSADLPPPPWQEEESAAPGESGPPDNGVSSSPFSPPEAPGEAPLESPHPVRKDRAGKHTRPQKARSLLSRVLTVAVLAVAAVVVGTGLWMGSASLRSPSMPLPPIPPAEEPGAVEMAEGLPVPALPKGLPASAESGERGVRAEKDPAGSESPAAPGAGTSPAPPAIAPPDLSPHEAALASFESGDHEGAAEAWRGIAAGSGAAYTIQVVVACQIDTVGESFERFGKERELFALPLQLSGRSCFRVCYGLFGKRDQAQAAIETLPAALQYELSVRALKGLI